MGTGIDQQQPHKEAILLEDKMAPGWFADDAGHPSSMRVMTAAVVLLVLLPWAYVTVATRTLQPLGPDLALLVVGALGAKAWQKKVEGR